MLSFHDYKCAAIRYVAAKALNPRCHMKVLQDDSALRPWHCNSILPIFIVPFMPH